MSEAMIDQAKELISRRMQELRTKSRLSWEALAKHVGATRPTLYGWVKKKSLPSEKNIAGLAQVLSLNKRELALLRKASERSRSLQRFRMVQSRKKREATTEDHLSGCSDDPFVQLTKRVERLEKEVFSRSSGLRLISRDQADGYVAGLQGEDWDYRGMRFVLTSKNFKVIDSSAWSEKEIQDTQKLVEELRRRLVVLAQIPYEDVRHHHIRRLAAELDELWRAYQSARSALPIEVVKMIDQERKYSQVFVDKQHGEEAT